MENKFYVGMVNHKRKIKESYKEKIVLYTSDNIYYIDLVSNKVYTTNSDNRDYVISDSLVEVNPDDFNVDYMYLLNRYSSGSINIKKKRNSLFK